MIHGVKEGGLLENDASTEGCVRGKAASESVRLKETRIRRETIDDMDTGG